MKLCYWKSWDLLVSEHKGVELETGIQLHRWGITAMLEIHDAEMDHKGFRLELHILCLFFTFQWYDTRHVGEYDEDHPEKYDTEDK